MFSLPLSWANATLVVAANDVVLKVCERTVELAWSIKIECACVRQWCHTTRCVHLRAGDVHAQQQRGRQLAAGEGDCSPGGGG